MIATVSRVYPPLKWHGGKFYLAPKIVALMPPHLHYVEPYAGGLSVLLARDPADKRLWLGNGGSENGVSEVVNDLNEQLTNFWRVLQQPERFARFQRLCEATPLSRIEFDRAANQGHDISDDPVLAAWQFFVRCRQSLAGRMKGFTSLTRNRTRRGMNGNVSEWLGAIEGLPAVHERLRLVVIENLDAIKLIRREDAQSTLFYLDPPYLHETRATDDVYAHEMGPDHHAELLEVICACKGRVMLSGYPSELYDRRLHDWKRYEFVLPNQAAGGKTKRRMTEVVWCNFY